MTFLRRVDPYIPLALLLCVFAVAPLTAPGFFLNAHDATIGTYFLWQFDAGLRDGAWWPVWGADMVFGYGHPLFMIIAPLAYYLAEVFVVLGLGIVGALKAVYALAFLGSALTMYLFARRWLGRPGALVAAVAYVYIPYHLLDIYVRGDLAEFVAMALFPAVLWAVDRTALAGTRPAACLGAALLALVYGALILTHLTMAVIFSPVAAAYGLWQCVAASGRRWRDLFARLAASAGAMLLGLGLAALFLVPALAELRYLETQNLAGGYYSYAKHFVYLFQFFSPFWGYGYAGDGPVDQMSYQLGAIPVALAVAAVAALAGWWRRPSGAPGQAGADPAPPAFSPGVFFAFITIAFVLLMMSLSQPLWDVLRAVMAFIQFPWRLLVVTGLSLAFLSGVVAAAWPRLTPALLLLLVLASYGYTQPQYTPADVSLKNMVEFQLRTGELLGDTVWVKERPKTSPLVPQYLAGQPPIRAVALTADATVRITRSGSASMDVRVASPAGADVLFYIRYFPGWQGTVDGAPVTLEPYGDQALMRMSAPAGEHTLSLRYGDTPARAAGKLVSLVALVLVGALAVAGRRRLA
jgi:hypothetical protein